MYYNFDVYYKNYFKIGNKAVMCLGIFIGRDKEE